VDAAPAVLGPVLEAADDDGVAREVEHRARAEGGDDLAAADLAGGGGLAGLAHDADSSSAATSTRKPSGVRTIGRRRLDVAQAAGGGESAHLGG
jgi:hypothetical protein